LKNIRTGRVPSIFSSRSHHSARSDRNLPRSFIRSFALSFIHW